MIRYLVIEVRSYEGRYHGDGDELPSPFRLFQALVAGAGISGPLDLRTKEALTWLESLPAPIIASPRMIRGQTVTMFMSNNDLDMFGGDVRNIAKTRGAKKVWRPRQFNAALPWIYAWPFSKDENDHAGTVCSLAEGLYQLGRGLDMAWAWGELLDEAAIENRLASYHGVVRRPMAGNGLNLACPIKGSLESLQRRHQACRFRYDGSQRVFVQPPKPICRLVSYESPAARYVFELRSSSDVERRVAWPLEGVSSFVEAVREAARKRLCKGMPSRIQDFEQHLVGRKPDGSNTVPPESRVRIIPIPSIGMHYAERAIRRLLVEIPAVCPLRGEDVRWAFSGAELCNPDTSETNGVLLSPSADDDMLRHYGVGACSRVFRSVTPVALPEKAKRRRIEPARKRAQAKGGGERVMEISRAKSAVVQALRHAGVQAPTESIRLQREPFEAAGSRVEPFAEGTRFEKERLWHVEVAFSEPIEGPLLLGDGRFLGLGLMAPATDVVPGTHAYSIVDGLTDQQDTTEIVSALRRAVMSRVQSTIGSQQRLNPFFSGHGEDGKPLRRAEASHIAFTFEPRTKTLCILSPHICDRRLPAGREQELLQTLDHALSGFSELRAGRAGLLKLSKCFEEDGLAGSIFGTSNRWESATYYVVTRHAKESTAKDVLASDVLAECRRIGLPKPSVEFLDVKGVPRVGLVGQVMLQFPLSIAGPIVIGRTRYIGGGLFRPVGELSSQ